MNIHFTGRRNVRGRSAYIFHQGYMFSFILKTKYTAKKKKKNKKKKKKKKKNWCKKMSWEKYSVSLKTLLQQGISEPEFTVT